MVRPKQRYLLYLPNPQLSWLHGWTTRVFHQSKPLCLRVTTTSGERIPICLGAAKFHPHSWGTYQKTLGFNLSNIRFIRGLKGDLSIEAATLYVRAMIFTHIKLLYNKLVRQTLQLAKHLNNYTNRWPSHSTRSRDTFTTAQYWRNNILHWDNLKTQTSALSIKPSTT